MQKIFFMKRFGFLFLLLASLYFTSCDTFNKSFTLEGTVKGISDGANVMLFDVDYATEKIDTIARTTMKGEKFVLKGKLKRNDIYFLGIDGMDQPKQVVLQNGNMVFYEDTINPGVFNIKGSPAHEDFNKMQTILYNIQMSQQALGYAYQEAQMTGDQKRIDSINVLYEEGYKLMQKEILDNAKKNPHSIVSPIYMLKMNDLELKKMKEIYDGFADEVKNSQAGKKLKDRIAVMEKTDIGKKCPEITGKTPEGKELKLSSVKGKVTLIDFWASWCQPCRMENPNVVALYERFHGKGFEIFAISLDKEKEAWVQAIAADKLTWYHISDLKDWKSKYVEEFGVQAIPQTYLLDEKGVIIGKNLNAEQLEAKLNELLGK